MNETLQYKLKVFHVLCSPNRFVIEKNENLSMFSQHVKQWIDIIYATKQKLTDRYELEISKYNWTGAWWTGGVKSPF